MKQREAFLAGVVAAISLVTAALVVAPALGAPVTIAGVADWHQPCLIGAPNGPNNWPNPVAGGPHYRAWCAPTAAADIMGYWRDVKNMNGVADANVYVSMGTINWAPPVPTDWQDDEADASVIPPAPLPNVRTAARSDLGWYLNTNDQGDPAAPGSGAPGAGTFVGSKYVALQSGLLNYLQVAGYASASVVYQAFPAAPVAADWAADWATIKAEISTGRPLMGLFAHGAFHESFPGSPVWEWGTGTQNDNQTGEDWSANGTGHAMTIVGYWDAADGANPQPGTNLILVQDNRQQTINGVPEVINNLSQQPLPFSTPNNVGLAPWKGYVTVMVPEPGTLALLLAGLSAAALGYVWRRCRSAAMFAR